LAWAIRLGLEIWIQGAFFIFFFPSIELTKPTTLDFYLLKYNQDIATVKMPRYTAGSSRKGSSINTKQAHKKYLRDYGVIHKVI
jgi:hypothetical protein